MVDDFASNDLSRDIKNDAKTGQESPDNSEKSVEVSSSSPTERVFLVLVDDSEEMHVALHFACQRAKNTGGRVALLHVQEPAEFMHWLGVETLMKEESRAESEALSQKLAAYVVRETGMQPVIYIREGDRGQEVADLLEEDKSISILVIAASTSSDGPGPVISYLTGKGLHYLRTPITIVPGGLSNAEIESIT